MISLNNQFLKLNLIDLFIIIILLSFILGSHITEKKYIAEIGSYCVQESLYFNCLGERKNMNNGNRQWENSSCIENIGCIKKTFFFLLLYN